MTAPIASGWSKIAGWDLHPLRNAAFARRTPTPVIQYDAFEGQTQVNLLIPLICHQSQQSPRTMAGA